MKKTILIVEDEPRVIKEWVNFFSAPSCPYQIAGAASDKNEANQLMADTHPSAMILGLNNLDECIDLIKSAKNAQIHTIITSHHPFDVFKQHIKEISEQSFFKKPASAKNIKERFDQLTSQVLLQKFAASRRAGLEEKIMRIFVSIGIPANVKGYHFLRDAVRKTIDDPQMIDVITKRLYPAVAKSFNTSASRVERAMRHAIEIAWNRGTISKINSIFEMQVYLDNERPTNGQFIALIAEKLLLESFA